MNLNRRYPGGAAKLRIHLRIFKKIWSCFAKCAILLKSLGGHICIEWPTACAYWKWECVENLVEMLGLKSVKVHGCALGLKSVVNGMPIKKPWTLKTDVPTIVEELEKYKCPGDHEHTPVLVRTLNLLNPTRQKWWRSFTKHLRSFSTVPVTLMQSCRSM